MPTECISAILWMSEEAAIISLYGTNRMVFVNRDGVCLLRGTNES